MARRSSILQSAASVAAGLPAGYAEFLEDLKVRIREARMRAGMAANQELLLLYYGIGLDLHTRLETVTWGTGIVNRLAAARLELVKWPPLVAKLTQGHDVILLERCKNLSYMTSACEHVRNNRPAATLHAINNEIINTFFKKPPALAAAT